MTTVDRSAIIPRNARVIYDLVDDISSYPLFLPWCAQTDVKERTPARVVATIHVSFKGIRQSFTTENRNVPGDSIEVRLVDGPFRSLSGVWRFDSLGDQASKVSLHLEYQLSSRLIEKIAGPAFEHIANTFVDAFVKRAESLR